MQRGRSLFLLLSLFLVTALLAAACGGGSSKAPESAAKPGAEPIVLGAVASLTGNQTSTGQHMLNGIKLAIEEWNSKGGVNGRPIKLEVVDDASQPSGAVNAFNKLIAEKKPVAVFGPNFSNFILAMEPYVKQAGVPVLTGSTAPKITQIGNPWFFRLRTNDAIVGKLAATFAVKEMGAKKIGLLYVAGDYGAGAASVIKTTLEQLGTPPIGIEVYNPEDKDMTAQLLNLSKKGADLIIPWSYPPDAGLILTQANQLGLKTKFLCGPAYGTPEVFNLAKEATNGKFILMDFIIGEDQKTQAWAKALKEKTKDDANFVSGAYYDGTNILLTAIQKAGTKPEDLRQALLATKGYKGIIGEFNFDNNGDGLRQVYIAEVKNQKPTLVKLIKEEK